MEINSCIDAPAAVGSGRTSTWVPRGYELASIGFALVLLVAAGLKAYAMAQRVSHEIALTGRDGVEIAAIGVEWALAGLLLSGAAKVWARRAALIVLAVFVCVAGWRLVAGEEDCGCFGPVALHPAWALGMDVLVLVAILGSGRHLITQGMRGGRSRVRFWLGCGLTVLAALVAVPFSVRAAFQTAKPSLGLVCESPDFDFGQLTMAEAHALDHTFVLRNVSSHPIRIVRKSESCGCTTSKLSKDVVAPNETLVLPVHVNWGQRSGGVTSLVFLETDEPAGARGVTLQMSGLVGALVSLYPNRLDFGEQWPGESDEKTFEVRLDRKLTTGVRINRVEGIDKKVLVREAGQVDLPLPASKFAVRVVSPRAASTFFGSVLIYTTAFDKPLRLPVSFKSRGAIEVSPSSVLFDFAQSEQADSIRVFVRTPLQGSLQASVGCVKYPGLFNVEIPQGEAERSVIVRCDKSCAPNGIGTGAVTIRVGQDALEIPIVSLSHGGGK